MEESELVRGECVKVVHKSIAETYSSGQAKVYIYIFRNYCLRYVCMMLILCDVCDEL